MDKEVMSNPGSLSDSGNRLENVEENAMRYLPNIEELIPPPNPILKKVVPEDSTLSSPLKITKLLNSFSYSLILRIQRSVLEDSLENVDESEVQSKLMISVIDPESSIYKDNLEGFDCEFFLSLQTEYSHNKQDSPLVYSRYEDGTLFTIRELRKWLQSIYKRTKRWKWPFLTQLPEPSATLRDKGLVFDSRFESGNLLLAVKVSDQEYKLMVQNDSLTNGNTQCVYYIEIL